MLSKKDIPVIATTNGSIASTNGVIYGLLITAGSSNASIGVYDNPSDSSSGNIMNIKCLANDSKYIDFSAIGGVPYKSGLYLTISNATVHVWKE